MKMLYINLVPITVGGGLQNTINFLKNFNTKELTSIKFVIILKDNKNLINICKERNFDYYIIKNTFISRLKYETLFFINKKNSIVFTLFASKPMLLSNQCGNNYEAIDENSNGYVFNPYDTNDIKKKFNIMIENRKDFNSMGKKSFEIANSKFHPRKIVSSFLEEI